MSKEISLIERKGNKVTQTSVFDGSGIYIKGRNKLLYNIDGFGIDSQKRLKKLIKQTQPRIADLLLWTNFKKPAKNLKRIVKAKDIECFSTPSKKAIDLGYYDNTFVFNTQDFLEELGINSLALGGAVADCAGICGTYNNGEIISLSHVGWQGTVNGVIEQLIHTYETEIGKEELSKVQFDLSPMAGVNYEWNRETFGEKIDKGKETKALISYLEEYLDKLEKSIKELQIEKRSKSKEEREKIDKLLNKKFDELYFIRANIFFAKENLKEITQQTIFLHIAEKYNIDFIKDKIVEEQSKNPKKVIFFLDRLIKRIFLENGVSPEQLNFSPDYTTDLNNRWPSYRIHSLWKEGVITASMTEKSTNGIIYDARMGVFNVVSKK